MTPDTPARPSKVRKYFAVPDFDAEGIEWGFLLTEDPGQGPLIVQGNSFWVVPKWDYDHLAQRLAESERKLAIAREGLESVQCQCTVMERESGHLVDCWNSQARAALAQISAEGQDERGGDKTKPDRCKCGGIILADTEDWKDPLCYSCWHDLGDPEVDPAKISDATGGGDENL